MPRIRCLRLTYLLGRRLAIGLFVNRGLKVIIPGSTPVQALLLTYPGGVPLLAVLWQILSRVSISGALVGQQSPLPRIRLLSV